MRRRASTARGGLRIWHVTLPGIRAIIAVQLILTVGNILNVSFDQIFVLITDLTLDVGETIDYYIYRVGLGSSNNFSLATASGMLKSVIGLVLVVGTNKVCRMLTDGEESGNAEDAQVGLGSRV